MSMPYRKYRPYDTVELPDRTWPDRVIDRAPVWCSTDLRDGNQALVNPMDTARKRRFFDLLVAPRRGRSRSASRPPRRPTSTSCARSSRRTSIPEDTTIAVLTQARPELIERSFEAIDGARRAIMHLYNSTSVTQRRVVFRMEAEVGITELAVRGALCAGSWPTTPTSRSCSSTRRELPPHGARLRARDLRGGGGVGADPGEKMIVNLPTTVEQFPPNVYADRIEWFCRHFATGQRRDLRPSAQRPRHRRRHRGARVDGRRRARRGDVVRERRADGQRRHRHDRAQPAHTGPRPWPRPVADRRGARDRRGVQRAARPSTAPVCRRARLHRLLGLAPGRDQEGDVRAGAFGPDMWDVPYLSIDPKDVGRTYEAIIRVNSQSGKGGVAYLMETSTSSTCRVGCRSTSRRRCRRSPTPAAAS